VALAARLPVTVATAETIALAERLGVEPRMFLEAIEGGPLDSAYAQMKGRMMTSAPSIRRFRCGWAAIGEPADR
jgi:3-hydroxyisobutyrate dehydrogenase